MLHRRLIVLLSIFLFGCFSVSAQNFSETHHKIINAVEDRDYKSAIAELKNLEQTDRKIFEANNYDYLLARMAEKNGDSATATANYQSVINRKSILSEYALWHLSQIFRASGNLFLERLYLQKLLASAPESLLTNAAQIRLVKSFFESKDYAQTIRLLENPALNFQSPTNNANVNAANKELSRENSTLLAQSYLQTGNADKAKEIFTKLIESSANPAQPDDFSLAGAKALDEIAVGKENFGKIAPPLSDTEYFRRAQIYQFNRDFPLARLHFKTLVEKFPASSFAANSLYQIGRGFAQERNFEEAIKWFERVQIEFPNAPITADALSQTATAYARVNKPQEAIALYQKFIEKYPNADNLDRAYLNIVDVLRDTDKNVDALQWTAKTREAFRGKLPEAIALFAQTRIHIAQNDWTNALADLKELESMPDLGGTKVPGGTNKAEITFLKGFVLENLDQYSEAIDVYLSIPDRRNEFYGWRATERLQQLDKNEKARSYVKELIQKNLAIVNQKILPSNIDRIQQGKNIKPAAQNILRLTTDQQLTGKVKLSIRQSYMWLPDYQYIRTIPSDNLAKQCFLPANPLEGVPLSNFSQKMYGRCELRSENRPVDPKRKGHFIIVEELVFLGLYDEAAPELAVALGANNSATNLSQEDAATLAISFKRGDWANQGIAFAEPIWRKAPADYLIELAPQELVELFYPTPYSDDILRFAKQKDIDPRFLLAIMRQESRFRPDVKSDAAARGLMQFISTTSDQIAAELKRENFKQDELYNPPTAILFGSQYLSDLFKIFPNQPFAIAASYNGGEDNMTRWLARAKSDNPDRYVPEIVFSQSKDYVYRVMANYRVYQMLYDEKLRAKQK